ncbi:MAG TPA: glycosyltransferase family 1 protein [Parafilimonas sp.]|nr:glycosyltransferase family 1 protein [Parafilimonas sp.]
MSGIKGKIKVTHFQRKPRPGFNFSIESIFESIRCRLKNKVDFSVQYCSRHNDGYFTKFRNILEASFRQRKDAVAHITGEVHFINLLMRKKNVLLTIHDCRFMQRKKGIEKTLMGWLYLKAPVKRSAYVTTVSEATKQEVLAYTGCKAGKITVIPVSVNPLFKPAPRTFNKSCPVILQIGAAENKNISRLIDALKNIRCRLVIVGEPAEHDLDKLIACNIDFTVKHDLSTEDLYQEYINCDTVSFVSTFEGFGMPIAEANCVERVVITSNISSMPEVAGNAACLVNPYDVGDMERGFLKIINDDAYREQLIVNGRENGKRFSPETVAAAYYEFYKKMSYK